MTRKPKFSIQPVARAEIKGVEREILGKTQDDGVAPLSMAKEIRLDRIRPDPNQPRRSIDEEGLQELAASIKEQGVLQPIVVQYVDDGEGGYFMLNHGERRWRAAQLAGLQTIPAVIREVTDSATRLVQQLMENIQREDLNAVDRAQALQALKQHLGNPPWETVAEKVGIKRSRLFQLLDVMKQPEPIREDIRAGRLTEKHSRALQSAPEPRREELRQAIIERKLSGPETMELARQAQNSPPGWTIERAVVALRDKPKPAPPTVSLIEEASQTPAIQPAEPEKGPLVDSPPGWTRSLHSALSSLQSALDTFDPAVADITASAETLCALLVEIIAKANALLGLLNEKAATAAADTAPDGAPSPAPPRT